MVLVKSKVQPAKQARGRKEVPKEPWVLLDASLLLWSHSFTPPGVRPWWRGGVIYLLIFFLSVWPDSEPSAPTHSLAAPQAPQSGVGDYLRLWGLQQGTGAGVSGRRPHPVPHSMGRRTSPAQTKETVSHCFPTDPVAGPGHEGKLKRLQGWPTPRAPCLLGEDGGCPSHLWVQRR